MKMRSYNFCHTNTKNPGNNLGIFCLITGRPKLNGYVTYTGHRYNINMRDIDLEKQSGSNLSTTLRPWSIEFWEVRSATGIKPVVTNKSKGYYYSIVGYKYDKRPTRRGVYIYNGKKIVIK